MSGWTTMLLFWLYKAWPPKRGGEPFWCARDVSLMDYAVYPLPPQFEKWDYGKGGDLRMCYARNMTGFGLLDRLHKPLDHRLVRGAEKRYICPAGAVILLKEQEKLRKKMHGVIYKSAASVDLLTLNPRLDLCEWTCLTLTLDNYDLDER